MLLTKRMRMRAIALWCFAAAACGSSSDATPDAAPDGLLPPDAYVDLSGPVFDPDHILQVRITMPPADWDTLRGQTREFGSVIEGKCLSQPAPSPFTTFHASVQIDSTTFADVGIHKKGFFGSLDSVKPSLKVTLDEFVGGQEYLGLEKLTLNNSHQDPAFVRQCLTYQVFAAAGMVVPRCNFAHVRVNGNDLGVYVNVETIDHHMMKKRYANGTGTLYEGTLSDFRHDWLGTFDPKGDGDGTDLVPIANVVDDSADATFVADLAPYLDVDRFITYWATEILTNHWDGYANDHNNFFVYHDPTTGKLDFIPWGPDGALQPGATFGGLGSTTGPVAVAAAGALAYRLFALPATKQQFLDRQKSLLVSAWNEPQMLAEIDRMEALIAPIEDPLHGTGWHAALGPVKQFVNNRRAQLTAAIDAGPTWSDPLPSYPCLDVVAHVSGTFSTTYGSIANDPFTSGSGTFSITMNGTTTTLTPVGSRAGLDPNPQPNTTAQPLIQVFGQRASDSHIIVLSISIQASRFFPREASLGFFDAFAIGIDFDPMTNTGTPLGFAFGQVTLTQASTASGAMVVGSFDTNIDTQGTPP
jgi:hypothetical protein